MRGLPATPFNPSLRIRRWDAVVLGSALPGLIAAIQLGRRGARVLVLEEEATATRHPGLREPFLLCGTGQDGVLGACLRELGIPLIDRRRVETRPLSFQLVFPDARIDVEELNWTSRELSSWGFAESRDATDLLNELSRAGEVEREAMLAAPIVRPWRRRALAGRRSSMSHPIPATSVASQPGPAATRGLPDAARDLPAGLDAALQAEVRALSNLGSAQPTPEARARLLASALEGGATVPGGLPWLYGLLRDRVESLFGEFRSLRGDFQLISANNQPGISEGEGREVWVGRALVLNAPRTALASVVDQDPAPEILRGPALVQRRLALHFAVEIGVVPEAMAERLICVRNPSRPLQGTNVVTMRLFPPEDADPSHANLIASAVVGADEASVAAREAEIEATVESLFPFSEGKLARRKTETPRWDDDAWLADPPPGTAWPTEVEIRLSSKPPIFVLDRSHLAGLGFEGDVLLGWRAGEAIAAEFD